MINGILSTLVIGAVVIVFYEVGKYIYNKKFKK